MAIYVKGVGMSLCKQGVCNDEYSKRILKKAGDKRKIITLCGSSNFRSEYHEINKLLTLGGNIVISVGVFRGDVPNIEDFRDMLEIIHKKKIDLSDAVFVINKDGHIGDHTREEITYAQKQGKEIMFLNEPEE